MARTINLIDAITEALDQEMGRDERVFILGEDIGPSGGVFKATAGLFEKYGEDRVLDTPLAEGIIIAAAIGSSMVGLRPVPEIQFADFVTPAVEQIVQQASKLRYRSAGGFSCPITVRICCGGGVGGGLYHSQENASWFVHEPGLKVVMPSTAYDAKGLLLAAIRDPDPVLYFEHKKLYRTVKGEVPEGDYTVPIGPAAIRREGRDMTILTYGFMTHTAMEAAEQMAARGVEAEVVDLRTLAPLDKDTILSSVRKTSKCLIVHEDKRTMGIGAELAAIVAEEAFEDLDGPILRVTGPDLPAIAFSPPLEKSFLVNTEKVVAAMEKLAAY
ncbi:MAG TPA: alpha-ketoacid dehydrogenase subunit beta [Candidatus Acidoferrales bacterium]|jgi:2-oxoisovalerate dehydrogenase E1 component beta subunit|nr:alpha-ketoacid dehydrogenase subunit beta [Candidatus Acidoferrales bacterium]